MNTILDKEFTEKTWIMRLKLQTEKKQNGQVFINGKKLKNQVLYRNNSKISFTEIIS